MFSKTGADIIVADTHQAKLLGSISRQTVKLDIRRNVVSVDNLVGNWKVFSDKLVHAVLYLLLLLA